MMNHMFNPRRFYLLTRNTVWLNASRILLVAGAVATLVILFSGLSAFRQTGDRLHVVLYAFFLFVSGILVTSNTFRNLRDLTTAGAWLTLPASIFEKFTSRLFLTSFGYVIATGLIYFVISALSEGINQLFFSYSHPLFNPFSRGVWIPAAVYLVLQSVFLVGSIYFRRLAFVKTMLFLSILSLALILFFFLTLKIIWWGQFNTLTEYGMQIAWNMFSSDWLTQLRDTLTHMLGTLFWVILAPFCWAISYFRLKEFEA
jgi:hypothetical protein